MKLLADNSSGSPMTREEMDEILNIPIAWNTEEDQTRALHLVDLLDETDVETAAQASYAYWLASLSSDRPPTDDQRHRMATREARRHLCKTDNDLTALKALKATCSHRRERRIDLIRACSLDSSSCTLTFADDAEREDFEVAATKLRAAIASDLQKQACFVRGTDRDGRTLLIVLSRLVAGTDDEEFLTTQVYLLERAIAATEHTTKGAQEKVVVVLNFGEFSTSLAPSWDATKTLVSVLQKHYPERLHKLVVIDPPFWMRTAYCLLTPFLNEETMEKFILACGDDREKIIGRYIDEDQAMPFMLLNGKLSMPVDLHRFQRAVPFCRCYDHYDERDRT